VHGQHQGTLRFPPSYDAAGTLILGAEVLAVLTVLAVLAVRTALTVLTVETFVWVIAPGLQYFVAPDGALRVVAGAENSRGALSARWLVATCTEDYAHSVQTVLYG
jgi:hypothetical protein